MRKLATVALLLCVEALGGTAFGQAGINALEKAWQEQNSICLGGEMEWEGPATVRMRAACSKRNAIMGQLRDLNRCYGRKNDVGYAMRWHECEPGSLTYDLPPPLRRGL